MRRIWTVGAMLLAAIIGPATASAGPTVSGEWETATDVECASECVDERQELTFEVESSLTLDVEYDVLALSMDNLWGLQGLLEATLNAEANFAGTSIGTSITLAPPIDDDRRIPPGRPLLVRSRFDTEVLWDSVELAFSVIHDDVKFEDRDASMIRYGANDQRFRAGAVVGFEGETAQDVELSAETGFCFDPDARFDLPVGSLSGEVCEMGLLDWSRTTVSIADLALYSSVWGSGELSCEPLDGPPSLTCELEVEGDVASLEAGFREASFEWAYDTIYPDQILEEITVELSHEANVDAELTLNETFQWDELDVEVERTVHRGDTAWQWGIDGTYERAVGVTDIDVEGGLERELLDLRAEVAWEGNGDRLHLDELSVDGELQLNAFTLESGFDVKPNGLDAFTATVTVTF